MSTIRHLEVSFIQSSVVFIIKSLPDLVLPGLPDFVPEVLVVSGVYDDVEVVPWLTRTLTFREVVGAWATVRPAGRNSATIDSSQFSPRAGEPNLRLLSDNLGLP